MDAYSYSILYHSGGNISFRNSVTFIAVRSKLDIFQGDTLPHLSRLFATNTTTTIAGSVAGPVSQFSCSVMSDSL